MRRRGGPPARESELALSPSGAANFAVISGFMYAPSVVSPNTVICTMRAAP
jgi:hypothetical protein